jgi:hypothetical protein
MKDLFEFINVAETNIKEKQKLLNSSSIKEKAHLQGFINNIYSDIYNYKITLNNTINSPESYTNFKSEAQRIMKQIENIKI